MESTDQDKQMIEDQYDQLLRLKHRLTITTCVAFVAVSALVGVSFLFSVSIMARGRLSVAAQDEVVRQQIVATRAQQAAAWNVQLTQLRRAHLAQLNAVIAQSTLSDTNFRKLQAQRRQAERDSEPVVAPVP